MTAKEVLFCQYFPCIRNPRAVDRHIDFTKPIDRFADRLPDIIFAGHIGTNKRDVSRIRCGKGFPFFLVQIDDNRLCSIFTSSRITASPGLMLLRLPRRQLPDIHISSFLEFMSDSFNDSVS